LVLKETSKNAQQLNKNYNEILKMPFIFNLHVVPTVRRLCLSSLSRHDIVRCEREVVKRVKKTTSVPETKKNE
jgi:hypothetical protein